MDATELHKLAKDLQLTEKQRLFAEAYAQDPEQNATRAAREAGALTGAGVTAHKWLKVGKIQAYISAVRDRIAANAPPPTTKMPAISSEEVLWRLSRQASSDIGKHLVIENGMAHVRLDPEHTDILRELVVREGPTDSTGKPLWVETKIKVTDPCQPLMGIARIYGLEGKQEGGTVNIQMNFANFSLEDLRTLKQLAQKAKLELGPGEAA